VVDQALGDRSEGSSHAPNLTDPDIGGKRK
jgi:hypothetical protein